MQHETKRSLSGAESAETADHSTGATVETPDLPDETVGSGSPVAASDEQPAASLGEDRAEPPEAGAVPTFLHEIARQMQVAVDRERARMAADTANSLEEHVRKVRVRAAAEAEELRRLAEEDVGRIHEWSAAEGERLRLETEGRISARREDLERHLRLHDDLIEREISGTSEAVEEYQTQLDRFVDRLAGEREPTEIAQLASQLPEPPRVEEIASTARAAAIAQISRMEAADEPAAAGGLVGVMEPSLTSQPTSPTAQESVPAQKSVPAHPTEVSPTEDEHADEEPKRRFLGARNNVDLVIRLVVIIAFAALLATVVLLVVTGQVNASSSGGPAPGA
jgi:hypothetical protein